MIYSVHQPHYLPYPGYLAKIGLSDVFVFLENVQFVKREFQNRNRVKGPKGPQWLTVPVKAAYKSPISEVRLDSSSDWRRKHTETLKRFYAQAPCLEYLDQFAGVIEREHDSLAELAISTTSWFVEIFNLNTLMKKQRDLEPLPEEPNGRIIEIGQKLGADVYLAGQGGKNYMDLDAFRKAGIEVRFLNYTLLPYPQQHGDFAGHLAAMDLLLNTGPGGYAEYVKAVQEKQE